MFGKPAGRGRLSAASAEASVAICEAPETICEAPEIISEAPVAISEASETISEAHLVAAEHPFSACCPKVDFLGRGHDGIGNVAPPTHSVELTRALYSLRTS
jgi:hypothetical protein